MFRFPQQTSLKQSVPISVQFHLLTTTNQLSTIQRVYFFYLLQSPFFLHLQINFFNKLLQPEGIAVKFLEQVTKYQHGARGPFFYRNTKPFLKLTSKRNTGVKKSTLCTTTLHHHKRFGSLKQQILDLRTSSFFFFYPWRRRSPHWLGWYGGKTPSLRKFKQFFKRKRSKKLLKFKKKQLFKSLRKKKQLFKKIFISKFFLTRLVKRKILQSFATNSKFYANRLLRAVTRSLSSHSFNKLRVESFQQWGESHHKTHQLVLTRYLKLVQPKYLPQSFKQKRSFRKFFAPLFKKIFTHMFFSFFVKPVKAKKLTSSEGYSSTHYKNYPLNIFPTFKKSLNKNFNVQQQGFKKILQPLFINEFRLKSFSDDLNNFSWFRRGLRAQRQSFKLIKSQRPKAPRMLMFLRSSRTQRRLVQTNQIYWTLMCQWRPLLRRTRRRFLVRRRLKRGQSKQNPLILQTKLKELITSNKKRLESTILRIPKFLLNPEKYSPQSVFYKSRPSNFPKKHIIPMKGSISLKDLNFDEALLRWSNVSNRSKHLPHSPVNLNLSSSLPTLALFSKPVKVRWSKRRSKKQQNKFLISINTFYKNFISRPKSRFFSRWLYKSTRRRYRVRVLKKRMWRSWVRRSNRRTRILRSQFNKKKIFSTLSIKVSRANKRKKRRPKYKVRPLKRFHINLLTSMGSYLTQVGLTQPYTTNKSFNTSVKPLFNLLYNSVTIQRAVKFLNYHRFLVLTFCRIVKKRSGYLTKFINSGVRSASRDSWTRVQRSSFYNKTNKLLANFSPILSEILHKSLTTNTQRFFISFKKHYERREWVRTFKRNDYHARPFNRSSKTLFSMLGFLYTNKLARQFTKLQLTKFKVKKHTFFDSYLLKKGILKTIRHRRSRNIKTIDDTRRYYYNWYQNPFLVKGTIFGMTLAQPDHKLSNQHSNASGLRFHNIAWKKTPKSNVSQPFSLQDDSFLRIKRIRFKPGYPRVWRSARASFNKIFNLNFRYQHRLTQYVSFFVYKYPSLKTQFYNLKLKVFLLSSRFAFDLTSSVSLINHSMVYVNGCRVVNPELLLFQSDVIQLIINLKYYVVFKWLLNSFFFTRNRLYRLSKSKFKKKNRAQMKQHSRRIPDWVLNTKTFKKDVYRFIEVDFFTLSSVLLYNPIFYNELNLFETLDSRFEIFNMYNWKYIT